MPAEEEGHQPEGAAIEALYLESRTFPPPQGFKDQALITQAAIYDEAERDWPGFWAGQAAELLDWYEEWHTIVEWELPFAKWFIGGKLNVSYNCLDRHVAAGRGDRVAFHWEGEPGDTRTITYADLLGEVQKFANVLKSLGVARGDRVAIYMPMIPELPVAMLACTRIGAAHSVVFGGFSADALRDRIVDAEAKVLVTADGGYRRGSPAPLKPAADVALADTPSITDVVVVRRTGGDVTMTEGRDHWWHEVMESAEPTCEPEHMDAEDLLYLLYTSGTTAKPKGIMHTTGGYLTQVAFTHKYVFDLHPDTDVYWCAADVGWVTGHSYIVYGPLTNGATSVMYEGTPDFPDKDRWWSIIERYGVSILYCAPDRHPHLHEMGDPVPRSPRPVEPAGPRLGRRAHQPRGVGVVLEEHRRRTLPRRGHLVADRDRSHHDLPAPRGDDAQARIGDLSPARHRAPSWSTTRARSVKVGGRLSHPHPPVAVDAPRHLQATRTATRTPTGAASRAATSPATGPSWTTRATCGSSGGSTTS